MCDVGYRLSKRLLDVGASGTVLALLSPALVGIGVAVKLESKGPALFRQRRVGRHGQPFDVLKFRSMVVDAPAKGPSVTCGDDPRVTRMGRFLRRWKLDELPQLWNVVVGEMSLVGPRPEVPQYVEMFARDYEVILSVRPGVTDEASIVYRNEEAVLARASDPEATYIEEVLPEKIRLAKAYIAKRSFLQDMSILMRTLLRVVRS